MTASIPGTSLVHHRPTDRFRPRAHVVWARQADATVVLDAERGLYYTLNDVASRVWELMSGGEPLMEILRCLEEDYEVTAETLQADVEAVLKQFIESDLIERVSP